MVYGEIFVCLGWLNLLHKWLTLNMHADECIQWMLTGLLHSPLLVHIPGFVKVCPHRMWFHRYTITLGRWVLTVVVQQRWRLPTERPSGIWKILLEVSQCCGFKKSALNTGTLGYQYLPGVYILMTLGKCWTLLESFFNTPCVGRGGGSVEHSMCGKGRG